MFACMIPYVAFDVFALMDPAHWTPLSASFIVLDGAMGILGLMAFLQEKPAEKLSSAEQAGAISSTRSSVRASGIIIIGEVRVVHS